MTSPSWTRAGSGRRATGGRLPRPPHSPVDRDEPLTAGRETTLPAPVVASLGGRLPGQPPPVSFSSMATTERDFYVILGVERTATDAEIKRAFRKLAQQWHPDVNTDPAAQERFKEINEAYQVLSDPERRSRYDTFGRAGVDGGPGGPGGPGSRGSAASRTSSTPSSAGERAPDPRGAAGHSPARTFATTCGSPSRRPSRGPRRRSSSPSSSRARRAAATAPSPAPSRSPARNATGAARSAPCARPCSARWSTSAPARAVTARARSSRRRATHATVTAGRSASGRSG